MNVAEEVGDLREAGVEERTEVAHDLEIVERVAHAAEPRVAHREVDRNARVTHAEPRMAVDGGVDGGAAQPLDQERREPIARALADLAFKLSLNEKYRSPFAVEAKKAKLYYLGGKSDDITVIVGKVIGPDRKNTQAS